MYLVELVKLQILFWVLEIRDIFGVNGRCWGRPKYKKNMSVPPPLGDQAFVVIVPCLCQYIAVLYKASDLIITPRKFFLWLLRSCTSIVLS